MASLRGIAQIFLRVATLTFGSANVTCALIRREMVEERQWMSPAEFALTFSLARVAPGTNLLAFCAGIGWMLHGWTGAIITLLVSAVPASIISVFITILFQSLQRFPLGLAAVSGAMASVVGLIIGGAWLILRPDFRGRELLRNCVLLVGAMVLNYRFDFSPISIVFLAAVVGLVWPAPKTS
jgi:chromate transporter